MTMENKSAFKLDVQEESQRVERRETLSTVILDYDVFVVTRGGGVATLSIAPVNWERIRLGILRCHPKSVADIEKFAEIAGDLFRAIAKEMRKEGKDDLRCDSDKMWDDVQNKINSFR